MQSRRLFFRLPLRRFFQTTAATLKERPKPPAVDDVSPSTNPSPLPRKARPVFVGLPDLQQPLQWESKSTQSTQSSESNDSTQSNGDNGNRSMFSFGLPPMISSQSVDAAEARAAFLIAERKASRRDATMTTLESGVRVASLNRRDTGCAVGIHSTVGSAMESAKSIGAAFSLEKFIIPQSLSESENEKESHQTAMQRAFKSHGGSIVSHNELISSTLMAEFAHSHVKESVSVLQDCVANAQFRPDMIQSAIELLKAEADVMRHDPQQMTSSFLQALAFRDTRLARTVVQVADSDLSHLNPELLQQWKQITFATPNVIVGVVGLDHADAVQVARDLTADFPTQIPASLEPLLDRRIPVFQSGENFVWSDESQADAQFGIAFNGGNPVGFDHFALALLQSILGGGLKWSTGGPGKGIHARIYQNVLPDRKTINAAFSGLMLFDTTCLFTLYGSCEHERIGELATWLLEELEDVSKSTTQVELDRARNQYIMSGMKLLEERDFVWSEMTAQINVEGKHRGPANIVDLLHSVKTQDIQRVAKSLLDSVPAVVGWGNEKAAASMRQHGIMKIDKVTPREEKRKWKYQPVK